MVEKIRTEVCSFQSTQMYTPPEADLANRKLLLAWKQKISVLVVWLSPAEGAALL